MAVAATEPAKTKFSKETCEQVGLWLADTQVEFVPNGKREGTASYDRYVRYSQARTIAEVLELGAKPDDLVCDFDRKLFKIVGGPLREAPLDPDNVEGGSISDVDITLASLALKCKGSDEGARVSQLSIKKLKLAKKYGVKPSELRGGTWAEGPDMIAARTKASNMAVGILESVAAEQRKVTSDDVLKVLRLWRFRENRTRVDVMREGVSVISCDRMGMMRKPEKDSIIVQETLFYPKVLRLFSQWLKDNPPDGVAAGFPFTSVFVNSSHCAKRHRDKGNLGPCVVASFGDFEGGRLMYWPEDDKRHQLHELRDEDKIVLDIRNVATLIDGNRAHEVEDYTGDERFSLVFYISDKFKLSSEEIKNAAVDAGCVWPTEQSLEILSGLLPPPKGCPGPAGAAAAGGAVPEPRRKKGRQQAGETKYSIQTCRAAEQWVADTKITFVDDDAGRALSAERYKAYSKAETIGEALRLGAENVDMLNDFENKLMKPLKGPKRNQPLALTEKSKRTSFDRYVLSVKAAHGGQTKQPLGLKFAQAHKDKAMNRKRKEEQAHKEKVLSEKGKRDAADHLAEDILKAAAEEKRRITDREVIEVLRRWAFHRNDARQNVLPKGADWVYSDTLGLVSNRCGAYIASKLTRESPHFPLLLNQWLKDHRPSDFNEDFPFTSISVNSGYAARLHRDGNNAGPSLIKGFGKYKGGTLGYWPDDDKSGPLEKLQARDRVTFDISKGLLLFDGNRGHEVDDFDGERFSVVWFTARQYNNIMPEERDILEKRGFVLPSEKLLAPFWAMLPKPRGYEGQALDNFFVSKAGPPPPRTYQWFDMSNPDEDRAAAQLLRTLLPAAEPKTGVLGALLAGSTQQQPAAAAPPGGAAPHAVCSPKPRKVARSPKSEVKQPRPRTAASEDEGARKARKLTYGESKSGEHGVEGLASAEVGLGMMQDGLDKVLRAAGTVEGGLAAVAEQFRPELMQYMQELLRFAGSQ